MATLEDVDFEDIGGTNDDSIEEPNDDRRETNKEGQNKLVKANLNVIFLFTKLVKAN